LNATVHNAAVYVDASDLSEAVALVLRAAGVEASDAHITAQCLLSAEIEGVTSHGVALLPLYVQRLAAGGVVAAAKPVVVQDFGAWVVVDAQHGLGGASSRMAVDLAAQRAVTHGVGFVTVRHAFHFGAAAFWSRRLAERGMVGAALSNTRPLMPAPGGAQAVVGNNPLSIAFPSDSATPIVVDMAMSATAMGKIRLADAQGEPIPLGWATDASGAPTTSAREAIAGMLLPAAGPKGFGLAVAIDLLCGALSGGAVGAAVKPLYGAPEQHYGCAHAFLAIDAKRANAGQGIGAIVDAYARQIRASAKAASTERLYAPGDLEREARAARGERIPLSAALAQQLDQLVQAAAPGRSLPIHQNQESS